MDRFNAETILTRLELEKTHREILRSAYKSLPEDEAKELLSVFQRRYDEDKAHRRALEIAKESRPRNILETLFGMR